jgi:hypothetical protein
LIILGGSLWHIKVELEDIVELVSRVEVSESFSNSGVFGSRSFESDS